MAVAVTGAIPGCGYSPGFRGPPGVHSIAVPMFNNQTAPLRREIEYTLTDAVRKEIQAVSDLRLTNSDDADMSLFGTVREFKEKLVSEGKHDEKLESSIVIAVDVVVEDYVNAKQWRERVTVREPLSVEAGQTLDQATQTALRRLAKKILEQIEAWEAGA
jgi:hypothetical protein